MFKSVRSAAVTLVGASLALTFFSAYLAYIVMMLGTTALGCLGLVWYNRQTNGAVWTRNAAGQRREQQVSRIGLACLVALAFGLMMGRQGLENLGNAILVYLMLFGILAFVVMATVGGKKSGSRGK